MNADLYPRTNLPRLRFGCIPPIFASERPTTCAMPDGQEPPDVDWANCVIPSDNQTEGSCVLRTTCGMVEALLRKRDGVNAIPAGYQLDAQTLYWKARKKFYNDEKDEGLQGEYGILQAIDEECGLLPPDTELYEVAPQIPAIARALQNSPLCMALMIGDAWSSKNVPLDGRIRYQKLNRSNILGGHETLCLGYQHHEGGRDELINQNSWGFDYAWNGLFRLGWETFLECHRIMAAGPWGVKLNPKSWANWDGWKKWLVKS